MGSQRAGGCNSGNQMSHADVSPSSLGIALNCSASVTKARGVISLSGPSAIRGTALHTATEHLLKGHPMPEFVEVEGHVYFLTQEDKDAVELCWELGEMLRLTSDIYALEQKLSLEWYFAPQDMPEPFFGTSDFVAYDKKRKILTVADWKFGRHVVDPNGPQLRAYALMALGLYGNETYPVDVVRLAIAQPQDDDNPIKSVELTISELLQWAHDVLTPALKRIGAGDETEKPGDHCTWCKRAGVCQALHARAIEIAQASFDDDKVPSPESFSTEDLGKILEKAELVEGWIRAVRAEVSHRIDNGEQVEGWKLVPKRANRKWINPQDVEMLLAHDRYSELMIDDVFTPRELRSPAQLEKALKKYGISTQIVDDHVTRESSGSTLVRSSDPREKVTASRGAELFDD